MIAFGELSAGRWDEAQQLAAESTALCEERGYRLMAWTGRYATALIAGNRGDHEACQEICEAMIEWATPRQLGHLQEFAHHALAQAALGAGDFDQCYAHATAISPPGSLGPHTTRALWVALDLVDAAVHTGRIREASAHVDAMRRADLGRLSPRFALITAAATAMVAPEAIDQGRRALEDAAAWATARRTADDLIWAGNLQLLEHEQRALVQPNFDLLSCAFARLISLGSATTFEARGARQVVAYFTSFYVHSLTRGIPHAVRAWPRITRFDDRWRWLVTSVVPRFRRFDADTRLVDATLRRMVDEAHVYAMAPCIHHLGGRGLTRPSGRSPSRIRD